MTDPLRPIRLLVADDHPLMREGIAAVLASESDLQLVAEASHGAEAVELFNLHRPDVTLMDMQMPGMDGVTATVAILALCPSARIVMLTTYRGDVHVMRALKAGACGYLLKGMIRKELMHAIRTVHEGRRHVPAEVAAQLGLHALDEALSPREVEVLRGVSRGLANKRIGVELGLTEETVKSHMKNILAKLHAFDRTQAVVIALRRGIMDIEP